MYWIKPIVELGGQTAVLTRAITEHDVNLIVDGVIEGRMPLDEGTIKIIRMTQIIGKIDIIGAFLDTNPCLRSAITAGLLPVVREGVIEVWRWEPTNDPFFCYRVCHVKNIKTVGERNTVGEKIKTCDLVITPPQPRMMEAVQVGNLRGYDLRNAALFLIRRSSPFPIAIIPMRRRKEEKRCTGE